MAEKAGVAYPYLIICELCELCEQMCRLSIFSGKCLYFQEKLRTQFLKKRCAVFTKSSQSSQSSHILE